MPSPIRSSLSQPTPPLAPSSPTPSTPPPIAPPQSVVVSTESTTHVIRNEQSYRECARGYIASRIYTMRDLASRHLTPPALAQKTWNSIKAKLAPWTDPPGWREQMDRFVASRNHLAQFKADLERNLSQATHPGVREDIRAKLVEVNGAFERIQTNIEAWKAYREATIKARYDNWRGTFTNLALPGANLGFAAGVTATATTIGSQENSAARLVGDTPLVQAARNNIHNNARNTVICAVTCTVAIAAIKSFALPALTSWRSVTPS